MPASAPPRAEASRVQRRAHLFHRLQHESPPPSPRRRHAWRSSKIEPRGLEALLKVRPASGDVPGFVLVLDGPQSPARRGLGEKGPASATMPKAVQVISVREQEARGPRLLGVYGTAYRHASCQEGVRRERAQGGLRRGRARLRHEPERPQRLRDALPQQVAAQLGQGQRPRHRRRATSASGRR